MAVQGQMKETVSNIGIASEDHRPDVGLQPESVVLLNAMSYETERGSKVRKPYTISKQREKWTDEEHQRFLEALKLYGRGWRQIQEHVGTKSAVQIRSHAQKFFSKVVRESSGSEENLTNPIEIPPPRPKKKPLHPYPRKSHDSLKVKRVPKQAQRSASPNLAVADIEIQSPTSILTAFSSEEIGSVGTEQSNRCVSPASCTSHVPFITLSPVQKGCDYVTSGSSEEHVKGSLLSPNLAANLTLELRSAFENNESVKEDSATRSSVTSIKLFGSTVLVTDSKYPSSQTSPTSKSGRDEHAHHEKLFQTSTYAELHKWNFIPFVAPTNIEGYEQKNFYPVESSSDATFYNGLPYFKTVCDQTTFQACTNSRPEVRMKEESPRERSCTGSNYGSSTKVEDEEKNIEGVESQQRQETSIERKTSTSNQHSNKGFVPYKRCLGKTSSFLSVSDEREKQKARICLSHLPCNSFSRYIRPLY